MKIYHYHPQTGELYAEGMADESFREPGVFIVPAHATDLTPPEAKEGFAVAWDGKGWTHVADHRGLMVFCTKSAMVGEISTIGPIPADYTTEIPLTDQSDWDGEKWVHNVTSERAAKNSAAVIKMRELHEKAVDRINLLTIAVEEEMADENDRAALVAWRRFIVSVYKVPTQAGYPLQIEWPQEPV